MSIYVLFLLAVPAFLLLLAAEIVLQIFLAKQQSWWAGIILPVISFVTAVILAVITPRFLAVSFFSLIVFIFSNIPTVILTVMYFICHKRVDKISEIKKMNIQDLE